VRNVASLYPTAMNHLAMNLGQQGFLDVAKTWIPVGEASFAPVFYLGTMLRG
jgi:hypothetical protein